MRRVTDPNGTKWRVDVAWTGVRLGERIRARLAARRARRGVKSTENRTSFAVGDLVDGAVDAAGWDPGDLVVGLVAAVVIALVVALFPWLLVVLLDAALILVFPFVAIAVIVWRVGRHRPFTITADRGSKRVAVWQVVGWREARRIERAIADAVVAGGDPEHLFPELATRR